MIKRCWMVLAVTLVLMASQSVLAAPKCSANETWQVPAEGAVAMFRKGDRAFTVGVASGGAQVPRPERWPRPGGCEFLSSSICSQSSENCGGTCTAYLGFKCDPCSCKTHIFC